MTSTPSESGMAAAATAATAATHRGEFERAAPRPTRLRWLWTGTLLVVLAFLVLYPVAMLLLGALTSTNPVVDPFSLFDLSTANFRAVLTNPNLHIVMMNTLIACAGGTAL